MRSHPFCTGPSLYSDRVPSSPLHLARAFALLLAIAAVGFPTAHPLPAQAPAAAPASSSQRGTVKTISGSALTLTTDAGKDVSVTVGAGARILQIAPGSTDLKTAQTIALTDIEVGDRILVSGKAVDSAAPEAVTAMRVILMKSTDIAQQKAKQQADWQRRGAGGIVSAADPSTGTLTVTIGAKKTQVTTSPTTIFRRYAGDSVRFEDAQTGTLSQIQPGDQVRVRGSKSDDGLTIQAEEIVSGTFRNLAGTVAAIDPSANTVTVKDLATKKTVLVKVTANSDFRKLPPEMAARFAARSRGAAASSPGGGSTQAAAPAAQGAGRPSGESAPEGAAGRGYRGAAGPGGPGAGPGAGGRPGGPPDLSQMIARLPTSTLADLKTGDAVMIVASQTQPTAQSVTAITLLSGVEPILAATPTGSAAPTLSPFGFGGGAPDMGGGGGGQ